jgi:hypothetical protein
MILANATNGTWILNLDNYFSMLKGETDSSNYLISFYLFEDSKTSLDLVMSIASLALSLS